MEPTFQMQCSKYQKLEKESNDGDGDGEDIISKLPDCILSSILSLLPTKDTIRTSILSTRWRHLWTSMSIIDLDDLYVPMLSFADIVDRILLLHDASDIKSLCLNFSVPVNPFRVNSWVFAAVMHRVQELDLYLPIRTNYLLPRCLFTSESLTVLKLAMDRALKVPTSVRLPSLKRLDLSMVILSDESSFVRLISSCPMLQELTFCNCGWVNIKKATICIPSLKSFSFTNDDILESLDCTNEIYAPNLAFLEYKSDLRVACLNYDFPSSVNASIDFVFILYEDVDRALGFLNRFLNMKSLTITSNTLCYLLYKEHLAARGPMNFNKLTTLTLKIEVSSSNIELMMDFLRKSPTLESLAIELQDISDTSSRLDDDWEPEPVPSCLESNLKMISISCFDGLKEDMHIAKVLLKKTSGLERMFIHCSSYLWSNSEKQKWIRGQLQMLPRGTQSCLIELVEADS